MRATIKKLRQTVVRSLARPNESVKWGIPRYSIAGEKIVAIREYKKHVNLYFFSGAKVSSKLLEGSGRGMRHI